MNHVKRTTARTTAGTTARGGFALPAVLLALVLVSALATGGLYLAMAEDQSSANMVMGTHAFRAAERGLQDFLGTRTRPYFEALGPVGTADTIGPVPLVIEGVDAQYTVYVQRLATRLFKVDSEGEITGAGRYAGSSRRLAEVVRIGYTYVPKDRAVTTQSGIRIRGNSGISGDDTVPTGWTDCEDEGMKKAIVARDTLLIDMVGNSSLTGDPKKGEDADLDYDDYNQFGDLNVEELKTMAQVAFPTSTTVTTTAPVENGGVCDTSIPSNWGDPVNPSGACHYYWPIIYAAGDLTISSSAKGQGILIVDGDLSISGGFEFHGLVFVYGALKASGNGNKVLGSVNIYGADESELGTAGGSGGFGNTQLTLSTCAIERAHRYNNRFARAIPLEERPFVDLSGLGVE